MPRPTRLTDVVATITLPESAVAALDVVAPYVVDPLCTPAADVDGLRRQLARGERVVDRLLADQQTTAPMPADAALLGALVVSQVPRLDVVVEGNVDVPLDQSVVPGRGQVCVPGSLHVRGALQVTAPLVICGDLVVDDVITDCGPQSVIVVLGNVRCRALITSGEVLIGGDLEAAAFVYGRYNDNVLEVVGTLKTPVAVGNDHGIEVGSLEVEHTPDDDERIFDDSAAHQAVLRTLVADDAVFVTDRFGDVRLDVKALAAAPKPWR